MKLSLNDKGEINIIGPVKGVQDYSEIKEAINTKLSNGETDIRMTLRETPTLTSSVISYLIKITHSDNANVSLFIENHKLVELLEQLNLASTLRIVQI